MYEITLSSISSEVEVVVEAVGDFRPPVWQIKNTTEGPITIIDIGSNSIYMCSEEEENTRQNGYLLYLAKKANLWAEFVNHLAKWHEVFTLPCKKGQSLGRIGKSRGK